MWIADRWTEYKVLDASDGEKLEDWSGYKLIRPDPQVIWSTGRENIHWKNPDAHYHRSASGGGEWEFFNLPETWKISYSLKDGTGLSFNLKPFAFKHTGVFPEQAANWEWIHALLKNRIGARVLNLFAYTGGTTLAAASAGARVTHVDSSKGIVSWARENAAASGLKDAPVRWLVDDCRKFAEREIRRGSRYDAIIMDPPSYGRGPSGETWKLENDIFPFLRLCSKLLSDDPLFVLVSSYTTGLQPGVLKVMLELAFSGDFSGNVKADELGIPIGDSGRLALPEGACGRWTA